MPEINVTLKGSMLTLSEPYITSGSVGTLSCNFSFDGAWEGFSKTAVFFQNPKNARQVVLGTTERSCRVPHEVLTLAKPLYIGVFGTRGTDVMTSGVGAVTVAPGSPIKGEQPKEPTPDVYAQILDLVEEYRRDNAHNAELAVTAKNEATFAAELARDLASDAEEASNAAHAAYAAIVTEEEERQGAEIARGTAEADRLAAESARVAAEAARANAESARAANYAAFDTRFAEHDTAIQSLGDRLEDLSTVTIKRYGVRRSINSSSPDLERVGDAAGLSANAGEGSEPAHNDFDNIYPWSHMRRCNLDDEGNVTAYEGEPTYKTDGSNGQVMVEIPRFYQKHEIVDGYEYWWVCEMPLGGYRLSPAFIGSSGQVLDKIYIAAYDAGYDGEGKATSIAGVHPEVRRNRTSFREIARARGVGWQLLDIAMVCDIMQFLFIVEFATLHCQYIMNGVVSLSYTGTHAAAFTELSANRIVITNAQAAGYVVGQSIEIGTSHGGGQIAKGRVITEITPLADGINTALVFDGEAVDITEGNLVYSSGWISGGADGVVASSGSATSTSSGKSPMKWRGIENAWGNVFQWIDGVNITDNQAWVSSTPAEYDDTSVAAPYKKLNFKNGNENGYVKTLGEDINYPWARFPTEAGASATTYYSDYYYQNTGLRACCLGGAFTLGTHAGLFYFGCYYAASNSGVIIGARLSYKA